MVNLTGPVFIIRWLGTITILSERHVGVLINIVALVFLWALASLRRDKRG